MVSNHSRILSEVVSLDAWHTPFSATRESSSVNVELSFREGRLCGDTPDFPFTFKISLKRARLTVHLEEPLRIEKSSVARNIPDTQIEQTKIRSVRDSLHAGVKSGGSIDLSEFQAKLSGNLDKDYRSNRSDEIKVIQTLPPILVSSEPRNNREYAWTLEPTYLPMLLGQPWDPVKNPRLNAKYRFEDLKTIHPIIKAEITCALEDLIIDDIRPKDPGLAEIIIGRVKNDSRNIAAQQHLKNILKSSNLEPSAMDNRFSSLLIASVLATAEG